MSVTPIKRGLSVPYQVLCIICLMYLTLYIDRVNIATAAPVMTSELGLSNADFGLAVSAFAWPYAILQLLGGCLSDRLGARRMLAISGRMVCGAMMLTGLVGGLSSLVAARLALGLGEGSAFPTATRALASWLPEKKLGICARDYTCRGAAWKRGNTAAGSHADTWSFMARVLRGARGD